MARFNGHCEKICDGIDVTPLSSWLALIPFSEWPQQPELFGQPRPAMINDPGWHGFGILAMAFVGGIKHSALSGKLWHSPMLSVVMPGHFIGSHRDEQATNWLYRIHFPITTNKNCTMVMDRAYHLEVGNAYQINTTKEHAIVNNGATPRIHFMIDVVEDGN